MDALENNPHYQKYLEIMRIFQDIVLTVNQQESKLPETELRIQVAFMNEGISADDPFARLLAQDLSLYPSFEDSVPCFSEYFLEHGTFKKEPAYEKLLKAMWASHFGFYEVLDRDESSGLVTLKDAVTNQKVTITDGSLGPIDGYRLYVFARLIHTEDVIFPSGYTLPFTGSKLVNKWIRENAEMFKDYEDTLLACSAYKLYKRCGVPVKGIND